MHYVLGLENCFCVSSLDLLYKDYDQLALFALYRIDRRGWLHRLQYVALGVFDR
jgi:hypothetical protein